MKVKIFQSSCAEGLEDEINDWLVNCPIATSIIEIKFSVLSIPSTKILEDFKRNASDFAAELSDELGIGVYNALIFYK